MAGQEQSPQFLGSCLFPKIFQTFRIAIQPGKLIIAFSALLIICAAGWVMDRSKTVVATAGTQGKITELQIYMTDTEQLASYIQQYKQDNERTGVFSVLWHFAAERFHGALKSLFAFNLPGVAKNIAEFFQALRWAVSYHLVYCIIFFVIILAVICIAGGSLCRIASLQFSKGEKPSLAEALRFGRGKFISLFTVPIAPVAIIIFIGLFILILGLFTNIPGIGELLMGVFMPFALIAGSLIAVIVIGTIAGLNLMYPAVAYDNADCFDAINRCFSYVYAKPWRMGFYSVIATVYGAICYIFVRFFTFLLLLGTYWFLQLGIWVENTGGINKLSAIWPEPTFTNLYDPSTLASASWTQSVAAFLVHLFLLIIIGLLVSFIISFYFSANTIIYALMRNRVDGTAIEDVYIASSEPESEPPKDKQETSPEPENKQS